MIGERLGAYTVLAKIGRGGMGTVYLASDTRGERVALKVLDSTVDGEAGLKRFAQELDLLRRADHPRIVRALGGLERAGPHAFFAMEYVRGRNLAQVLAEVGRLEPQDALKLAAEALEGLGAAHAAGVLHRDVKSANLLLDETGSVKVCDFGLARAVDQTRVTLSGQLLGTPAYASPEQARGHESRVESDLYALGVVLYEALTGTLPFRAETPLALLRLHLDETADPPSARRPGLPQAVDDVVLRALAKRPQDRFSSAGAMREAVLAALRTFDALETRAETPTVEVVRRLVSTESAAIERAALQVERAPSTRRALAIAGAIGAVLLVVAAWRSEVFRPGEAPPLGVAPTATSSTVTVSESVAPVATRDDSAPPDAIATLALRDGGARRGTILAIGDGQVTLRLAGGGEERVPLSSVASIKYDR